MLQCKPSSPSPVASAKNWLPPRPCMQHHTTTRLHKRCQTSTSVATHQHPVVQESQFGHVQVDVAQLPRQAIAISRETGAVLQLPVEVSLQITYRCTFGQQLAVVGSFQGWQIGAAFPMTWQAGDTWSAVLSLHNKCDVEYKYVVLDQHGQVARWQEGGNSRLSLRESGVLLHVTDSWAHESRQVHEIGVPVPSQQQQQWRAAGNISGRASAASGQVLLQNNITAFTPSSPSRLQVEPAAAAPAAEASQQQLVPEQQAASSGSCCNPVQPDQLSTDMAAILPLLQTELASALKAIASYPKTEAAPDDNLAEGLSVLETLQQQLTQDVPHLPAELLSVSFDEDGEDALELLLQEHFAEVEEAADAAAAVLEADHVLRSVAAADLAAGAEAAQTGTWLDPAQSSSSSSSHGRQSAARSGSRSPSGSPSSTLASASEDEIAAALLSDDCEEACFCLVDAICSCMCSEAGVEACEVSHGDEPAEDAAGAPAFVVALTAETATPAVVQHAVPVEELVAQQVGALSVHAEPPAADLQQEGSFTFKQGSEEVRTAAFAGVQHALQESAELLERLSDPTDPLLLQADRRVADAKRQMGHLLAA